MSLPVPLRQRTLRAPTVRDLAGRACATLAAAALALGACAGGGGAAPAAGDVDIYETRGVVVRVPDPADPLSNLAIRHEAIDDFRSIDGEVVGMGSMSMPFPLADGVELGAIAPGDKVAFTLEVEWEGEPPYRVSRIEKLPAETELDFREASPPGE
jgi:Cu/Ag efflux protein CusF